MNISGRMTVKRLKEEFKKEFGVSVRVYKGRQFADDSVTLASIRAEGAPAKGEFEVRGNTKVGNVEKQFKDQMGITIQIEDASGALADNNVTLGSLKK